MKLLQVYIDDKDMKRLKQQALDQDTTVASIVRSTLTNSAKTTVKSSTSGKIPDRGYLTEVGKLNNTTPHGSGKQFNICKHNQIKGLCKQGCK